jgi:hypothetical protein
VDDKKIIKEFNHEITDEDIKTSTDILHHSGTNPEQRKKIENEQEAWRTVNAMFEDKEKEFLKKLDESKKVIDEKDKLIDESKKVIDESKKVIDESKKVIDEKDKLIDELMKKLSQKNSE